MDQGIGESDPSTESCRQPRRAQVALDGFEQYVCWRVAETSNTRRIDLAEPETSLDELLRERTGSCPFKADDVRNDVSNCPLVAKGRRVPLRVAQPAQKFE